jgi:N-acetylglucosamine malate deacetylase 1
VVNVLAVVAHPDDEVVGCGATLHHMSEAGARVRVLLTCQRGDPALDYDWNTLLGTFDSSCKALGAEAVIAYPLLPEFELNGQALLKKVEPLVKQADIVFTHNPGDIHQTHQAVALAVELSSRPFRRHREVLVFESPTATDQGFDTTFQPNTYQVLNDDDVGAARYALGLYHSELEPGRNPIDLEAHLRSRGATIGRKYAQAFRQVRRFL